MIPKKLTLTHFIGIQSGLGLDTITVDYAQLLNGATLVSLIGENGQGKTTVLDNTHPYRVMPSKSGGYNPGGFSYYDHTTGTAGKLFEFEQSGDDYQSELVIKGALKTKTTAAYLRIRKNNEWEPVTLPDGTISDGKTATYDACVEHVCGAPEMFFTSAFSCQSRRPISSYKNAEIKQLMSELLGLDDVLALGERAKSVAKGLIDALKGMRHDLSAIAAQEADLRDRSQALSEEQQRLPAAQKRRSEARSAVQAATRQLADVQAENNAGAAIDVARNKLSVDIAAVTRRMGLIDSQREEGVAAQQRIISQNESNQREDVRVTGENIAGIRAAIAEQQALSQRAQEVESATAALHRLDAHVTNEEQRLQQATEQHTQLQSLQVAHGKSIGELQTLANDGKHAAQSLSDLESQAELIKTVSCVDNGLLSQIDALSCAEPNERLDALAAAVTALPQTCPLLGNARQAQARIPEQVANTEQMRASYRAKQAESSDLAQRIQSLGDTAAAIDQINSVIRDARRELQAAASVASLSDAVQQAGKTIAGYEQQIQQAEKQLEDRRQGYAAAITEARASIANLEQSTQAATAELSRDLAAKQAELNALPEATHSAALASAEQALASAEQALHDAEKRVDDISIAIARLEAAVNLLTEALDDAPEKKARADMLESEIGYWQQLSMALSNNGIIALAIDDAGPTLASITNDLLRSAYGPRFSVAIKTQTPTKTDGTLREDFRIVVYDAESDSAKDLEVMSGGEKIWIEQAVIRAVALYQADASGRRYGCLFADETDGALDPDKKRQFMKMKRRVLELGGYRHEIFISHTPELWELADSRIHMSDFISATER